MKVGFIGLDHMGSGMAASLIKAGHDVTVYNRTSWKSDDFVRKGAVAASRIAVACAGDVRGRSPRFRWSPRSGRRLST
jgi:3-hydroxyisobutyrate dehydrogenase-like beta-hydroxyacid dehydrogenase